MDAQKHYEKFWSERDADEFESYERNAALQKVFSQKSERVLDLGCGDGLVSEYLQKSLNKEVVAADISNLALKRAKNRGLKTVIIDEEKKLPFKDNSFDCVFWGDNVEHLFNPEFTLSEIRRVLKKNGKLILSCPNMGYWRYRLYYLVKGNLPDTEWSGNPPWYWSHIRFFNISILSNFLKTKKFSVSKIVGVNKLFLDKYLANIYPDLFSMILLVEAR